jgi:hypothetical protein
MHPPLLNYHHSTGRTWSATSNVPNQNTAYGIHAELAPPPTGDFQQLYPIADYGSGVLTQSTLPICDTNWTEGFQNQCPTSSGPSEALAHQPIASTECIQTSTNTIKPTLSKRVSEAKARLVCTQSGCKLTFARKYELERHRKTIHDCNVSIVCSVYGCNRIAKPFPRVDKFYEHVRKHHKGPERFLCVVESCRQGPLTRTELVEHLNARHSLRTLEQPHLENILNCLNLGGQFRNGEPILLDNINACPLRFLGCSHSHPPSSNARNKMEKHLRTHDLLERSKGYKKIVAFFGSWMFYGANGVATCPICRKLVCTEKVHYGYFIDHVDQHTKEERAMHAAEIAQLLRPYLTGQESMHSLHSTERILRWTMNPEFRARCEEAGVFPQIKLLGV